MNHEECVLTATRHTRRFKQSDASHLAILSATRSFPLQVRNNNFDGTSELQNCFDKLLTRSSCFEMVNKQDIMIESWLSDDM